MVSPTQILLIVSFLDMFSVSLIYPQLQNQMLALGYSHVLIGAVKAAYYGSQLIAGPIIGNLSDLKGRKPTLFFTFVACGGAYFLLGVTTSITVFFLLRIFLGTVKHTQMLTKSIAPDYVQDSSHHSALFGKLSTLSWVGMSLGPVAGGHLIEAYPEKGFMIIGYMVAFTFALNAYLINQLPEKGRRSKTMNKTRDFVSPKLIHTVKKNLQDSIENLKRVDWPVYWDVLLYKIIITFCIGMHVCSFAVFLKTAHNVSPKYLGYIAGFEGGIACFCTYFIDYINRLYKNDVQATERNFHVFVATTIAFLGMGFAPNLYVYLLFLIPLAISSAVSKVTNLEMIVRKDRDEHRGSVIGATGSVRSLAGVVIPLIVGVITEYIGVSYVIFFAAVFSAMGVVVSYKFRSISPAAEKAKNN